MNGESLLWKNLPESLQGLPPQPAVTAYLLEIFHSNLEKFDLTAFSKQPLPRFLVTPAMVDSMLHFDAGEYWKKMLSDRWGEHQVPDLPAYRWISEGRQDFVEYMHYLRPYNARLALVVAAAKFYPDGPWFGALEQRAAEFAAWCASDECSIWAGDYYLCGIVEQFSYFFDMNLSRLGRETRQKLLDGFEIFARKLRAVIDLFRPDQFTQDSHVFMQTGIYAELSAILHAHGRAEGTLGLKYWKEHLAPVFPGFGGNDGGWAQGVCYWRLKLPPFLIAAEAMRDLGYADLLAKPFFANTGYFKWYIQPPYMRRGAMGDNWNGRADALDLAILRRLGMLYAKEDLVCYADHFEPPRGCEEAEMTRDSVCLIALLMLLQTWNLPVNQPRPAPAAPSRHFKDVGVIGCHSALGDEKRDVMVLFRSSSYGSAGHAHADQNSFAVEAFGQSIFIDSGYYPDYHHPHMKGFAIQTMAHNAILLNNQGQSIRNFHAVGKVEHFETEIDHDYMIGECAAAYPCNPELVRRHLWFQRDTQHPWMLVVDHVILRQPGNIDFLLHSYEEPRWDAVRHEAEFAGWRLWGTQARARVQYLHPANLYWRLTDQFPYPADGHESNQPRQWHACVTSTRGAYEHWMLTGIVIGKVEIDSPFLAPTLHDARPRMECIDHADGWHICCGQTRLNVNRLRDRLEPPAQR